MKSRQELARVRGWLLVFVVVLIPHGVTALVGMLSPGLRAAAHVGNWGLAVLVVTAVGNLGGIVLLLSRNRAAPAFFTLYPPVLLVINIVDPHLLVTANARLAALGSSNQLTASELAGLVLVNAVIVGLMVGYWLRSKRVRAVYGSVGLEVLRRERVDE